MNAKIFINRQDEFSKKDLFQSLMCSIGVFIIIAYVTRENAFVTFEATKSLIFAYIMGCIWTGFFNTVSKWSEEENYMLPRIKTRLFRISTYLCGTYLSQTILCIIQGIIATIIFSYFDYDKTGLVFSSSNMEIFITFWLIIQAAMTLGLFVGLLVTGIKGAMTVLPVILISEMLFSKGIFEIDGIIETLSSIIEARYGIAAIGSICNINQYPLSLKRMYPMIEQTAHSLFNYSKNYVIECWIHLVILIIIPMILSYFILRFKAVKKH